MTDNDVKEFTDIEIAVIALVKVAIKKQWKIGDVINECMANAALQKKLLDAFQGCTDVIGELKNITIAKGMDIVKVAIGEIMAEGLLPLGNG